MPNLFIVFTGYLIYLLLPFSFADGLLAKPDSFNVISTNHFEISSPTAGEEETIGLFLIEPTDSILEYSYDEEVKKGGIPMVTFHKIGSNLEKIKAIYSNLFR